MDIQIKEKLKEIEIQGLERTPVTVSSAQGPYVTINNQGRLLLCSNNYLGLANHPEVKEAAIKAAEKYGVGTGASRLISGTMPPHVELEKNIMRFKKAESALLFNSGYNANLGVIPALVGRGDEIFSDKFNHASLIDGSILSRASVKRFRHRDSNHLEGLLKKSNAKKKLIVTDGIFSMNGDIAPMKEIVMLADKYSATVYLDDAHAEGVLGKNGCGTLEHFGITHPSTIEMGTLGKAFGSFGAFVTGNKELKRFLLNRVRSFIYTTALPPAICAAASKAIVIANKEPERRKRLLRNAEILRQGLKDCGFDTLSSASQIIPVVIGEAEKTMTIARKLLNKGIFVQGIRPPTVPKGKSRLRITVTSEHTIKDLEFALHAIKETINEARD